MNEITKLLEKSITLIPDKMMKDLPKDRLGLVNFQPFETSLWQIGEQIRQFIVKEKNFQFNEVQIKLLVRIIQSKNARWGRQSFIMLLGKRKYSFLAPQLILYIEDPDVELHIFDTIYKMRAMGYKNEFIAFQKRFKPLVGDRKKIQKYLNDFQ